MKCQGWSIVLLVVVCSVEYVFAVPAYPRKVFLQLSDGTEVPISLKGDEHCKWAQTEDGYTLLPSDSFGWCFAQADDTGSAVPSAFKLCAEGQRSETLRDFLDKQPKYMKPAAWKIAKAKRLTKGAKSSHRTASVVGERRALVILMEFADLPFRKSAAEFDALFNEKGYCADGAQGSVYDYFREVSYGQLSLHSDILGPYRASRTMAYYGANQFDGTDSNPYALFLEAIQYAMNEVDLSTYDMDGDGYVDNVHIVFAGYGEEAGAASNAIWSHEAMFPEITVQGMKIDSYSCTPELRGNRGTGISRIGSCCHEMGHALGALDYYDTDYSADGEFEGTGEWDIMASGSWNNEGITPSHFNPYVKAYDFGWVEVKTISTTGDYVLEPSTTQKDEIYRVNTNSEGDYYLLESRVRMGFDSALPGEGLMVYHVHPGISRKFASNAVNAAAPQMMYPVCASSPVAIPTYSSASYGDINTGGCPFPGTSHNTSFGAHTVPAAFSWDGLETEIELYAITQNANGSIAFTVGGAGGTSVESEMLWTEDFELPSSVASWGGTDWAQTMVDETDLGAIVSWHTMTEAANGTAYLFLRNRNELGLEKDVLYSPQVVENADGNVFLRFAYALRTQVGTASLKVYAMHDRTGEEELLLTLAETAQDWTEAEVRLPQSEENLRIKFAGTVNGMGCVYLDAVSVGRREKPLSVAAASTADQVMNVDCREGRVHVAFLCPSSLRVYALDGCLKYDSSHESIVHSFRLLPGLYILKAGTVARKILVH